MRNSLKFLFIFTHLSLHPHCHLSKVLKKREVPRIVFLPLYCFLLFFFIFFVFVVVNKARFTGTHNFRHVLRKVHNGSQILTYP